MTDFFGGIFWEKFFGRIFMGGIFWEDFWEDFFGEEFNKKLFEYGRN